MTVDCAESEIPPGSTLRTVCFADAAPMRHGIIFYPREDDLFILKKKITLTAIYKQVPS